MFSSRVYSPKQWLAAQLSSAVAEYFDVDPQRVETNLLKDAKVVLYDLELKPQQQPCENNNNSNNNSIIVISGHIQKVEFAWTWEASATLITNVTFTMEGVHVQVKRQQQMMDRKTINPKEAQDQDQDESMIVVSTTTTCDDADNSNSNNHKDSSSSSSEWKSKYSQQILDHLKLLVTDFTVHIQLDDSDHSELLLQAKDIQVETLSPKSDSILRQRLVWGSLGAWIQRKTGAGEEVSHHPVLEPFGYEATVQRISGRRFVDGVTKGLMVQGKLDEGASAIRLHAGVAQIQALNQLQQVLLNLSNSDDSSSPSVVPAENSLKTKGSSNATTQEVPMTTNDPSESSRTTVGVGVGVGVD
jgi:hypothetical protein